MNVIMAGVSGLVVADASAVSSVLLPAMARDAYDRRFAAAINAAAATIGPSIPPSIPMVFLAVISDLSIGRLGFLLVVYLFFLFLGCIMDAIPAMLIFFPVLLPVAKDLGIDPIHFGVVVVLNLMIGLLTPPVGGLLFLEAKIADIPFEALVVALVPYLAALLVVLGLITYVLGLVTFVPNLVFR